MPVTGKPIQRWWVIQRTSGARGGPPQTSFIASMTKPVGEVAGPFSSQKAAQLFWDKKTAQPGGGISIPNPVSIVQGWLGGLGGSIGSGIEAGFIQSLKDIWDVILGPLEVLAGIALALLVLVVYFKDDLVAGAKLAAMFMSAGA